MDKEKIIERLKKLKVLAERGEKGGERESAREKYENLKKKYGISEEDILEMEIQKQKNFGVDTLIQTATVKSMLKSEQKECEFCPVKYGQKECKECGTYENIQHLYAELKWLERKGRKVRCC